MVRLPFFSPRPDPVARLFGDIVTASRVPDAYRHFGVSDDFEGRFERLVLMMTLALRRLKLFSPPADDEAQRLIDLFVSHIDDGLRRSGVSDVGVGKKVKALTQGFYGRLQAYSAAIATNDQPALREALSRNLYGGRLAPDKISSDAIVEIERLVDRLASHSLAELLDGDVMQKSAGRGHQ